MKAGVLVIKIWYIIIVFFFIFRIMFNKKHGGYDLSFTIYKSSSKLAQYSIIVDIIYVYRFLKKKRFSNLIKTIHVMS